MEAEFGSCESFGIDDGQLDDLSPQECFVLGYELSTIAQLAVSNLDRQEHTVHSHNMDRIESFLRARGRTWRWTWPEDDRSESWVYLTVLPCPGP